MNTATNALGEFRSYLMMTGVFVLGVIGGGWAIIAPFSTSWPWGSNGSWTHATWAIVIPGAALLLASGAGIVLMIGFGARVVARVQALRDEGPA